MAGLIAHPHYRPSEDFLEVMKNRECSLLMRKLLWLLDTVLAATV
jgi:hypothetical protein